MKHRLFLFTILAASISTAFSATEQNLERQSARILSNIPLKEIQREVDAHQITHIRLQQTYEGLRVWGGDVMMHIPQGEMTLTKSPLAKINGLIYENIAKDLPRSLKTISNVDRESMAMEAGLRSFAARPDMIISDKKTTLMIYIDENQKARYAYLVSFYAKPSKGLPAKPVAIIDAETFKIYEQWDNIQTADGGGFGGNPKIGQLVYDGLDNHLSKLNVDRFETLCSLYNSNVVVRDVRKNDSVMGYNCQYKNPIHNRVYWNGDFDHVNEAYSPGNDALYAGQVIKDMYQLWYGIPVLTDSNGRPMKLNMRVHEEMENASWDGLQMTLTFGDGGPTMYPLVSLGIAAHEISHGFTEQHSNLVYKNQSGGLNESFSDMAAQAAEFYSRGSSSWMIGAEIMKEDIALRYMDEPTKDCGSQEPGNFCSISNVKDYRPRMEVHYSSGIFNKVFYLMANTPGWDTRKAFDVMVAANRFYWIPNTTFEQAACGVLAATQDLTYSVSDVTNALISVGIDTSHC